MATKIKIRTQNNYTSQMLLRIAHACIVGFECTLSARSPEWGVHWLVDPCLLIPGSLSM